MSPRGGARPAYDYPDAPSVYAVRLVMDDEMQPAERVGDWTATRARLLALLALPGAQGVAVMDVRDKRRALVRYYPGDAPWLPLEGPYPAPQHPVADLLADVLPFVSLAKRRALLVALGPYLR